jgi:hypothetical protein
MVVNFDYHEHSVAFVSECPIFLIDSKRPGSGIFRSTFFQIKLGKVSCQDFSLGFAVTF